jgi:hypothetical protein
VAWCCIQNPCITRGKGQDRLACEALARPMHSGWCQSTGLVMTPLGMNPLVPQVGVTPAFTEHPRNHCERVKDFAAEDKPLTICPPEADPKWRFFWRIVRPHLAFPLPGQPSSSSRTRDVSQVHMKHHVALVKDVRSSTSPTLSTCAGPPPAAVQVPAAEHGAGGAPRVPRVDRHHGALGQQGT